MSDYLSDLLPEGAVAGSEERVFARVPAQKMQSVSVLSVGFAAGPDFMKQESAWRFDGAVQIEGQAAFFFSRRADQRT